MPKTADELFQIELAKRGLKYVITKEGLYEIQIGDVAATISLENIRRDFQRDGDPAAIARFAKQLDRDMFSERPKWPEVKTFIRYSLEPAHYETGFGDAQHEMLTDELAKVFVFVSEDGSTISWITNSMLDGWMVTCDEVAKQADLNMDQLVCDTSLTIQEVDDVKLGMLCTDETPFKASLILSPRFRDLVVPTHGWPVYAVAPARDFVYVISQHNRDFLGRLGTVVIREYNESGYPITQDVLEVNDQGLIAIGSFAAKP